MIFNLLLGVAGLILGGDSFGKWARGGPNDLFALAALELIAGLYFITAAIGGCAG